jgi:hypothetical protein
VIRGHLAMCVVFLRIAGRCCFAVAVVIGQ